MRFALLTATLTAAAFGAVTLLTPAVEARPAAKPTPARAGAAIDLATPAGGVTAMRKIWCTMTDGEPVVWYWKGEVFSRKVGEADKKLFNVEGINVRTCGKVSDPKRGDGVRSVSREILLYLDPKTNQVLSKWNNPWTGQTVDVLHIANDPVNGEFWPTNRDGSPFKFNGEIIADKWFLTTTVPLFYKNPLAGDYQEEAGGQYHATEMFNFMGEASDLTDPKINSADAKIGWVRLSDFLPWMKMGSREGVLYFHTAGTKLHNWDAVSETMKSEVAKYYPEYRTPPPLDDKRPNETSWTYYKKVRDGVIKAPQRN